MKRILFLTLFAASVCLKAQTTFWTEGFGTSCSQNNSANNTTTANGTWLVTHVTAPATDANQWFISATESGMAVGTCGSGCLTAPALINRTLHISNVPSSPSAGFFCPTGDCGAAYDSGGGCGFGLGCVSVNDRAESPVINCTGMSTITLGFSYLEGGDAGNDFMEVMYSANGGTTWSSLGTPAITATSCGASQGLWTSFSVALPATANNNANVKIGFRWQNNDDGVGNDPSVAIDSIKLSVPSAAIPVVTITPSPTTAICQNATLTLNGSATNGSITAWSWSVTPSVGVVFSPSATAQNVSVTFTTSGTYTFTLEATNASGNGTTTQTISVLPSVTPSVSIAANPGNPICAGQAVSFTATPTNGGITPAYQWQVNGTNAGTNSVNFSSSTLNNNDIVSVNVTSNASCASPTTAIATYTVQVTTTLTPSVSIAANPGNPICAGQAVTFTATPTNGGTTPAYQWQVNGTNAGTNSVNFNSSTLVNNDVVSVILTSNSSCASPTTAIATYTIQVTTAQTPSVTITPNPASACSGGLLTFTAAPANGGSTPAYQWQVNGVNAGTNASTFTLSAVAGQQVDVILTSNAGCLTTPTANSNTVAVTINPTPTLTVIHGDATVCPATPATIVVSGTSGSTFTWTPSTGLNVTNNDTVIATNASLGIYTYSVTCSLAGCSTIASVNITVASTFTISTAASPTICPGQKANLSVTGGTTWLWTPATNLSCTTCQHPVATPSATTVYTVTATSAGCTSIATQTVVVSPSAIASFGTSGITVGVPQTVNFINVSANANGYIWNFGDNSGTVVQTSPSHIYNTAGVYTVTLIAFSANGCNDTINSQLIVSDTAGLTMPNIFTPNGDGINDVFAPNAHGLTTLACIIYDRWGAKITTLDTSTQQYWDGHTTSGLACSDGTYFYLLTATDVNGKSYSLKGFIQLIR